MMVAQASIDVQDGLRAGAVYSVRGAVVRVPFEYRSRESTWSSLGSIPTGKTSSSTGTIGIVGSCLVFAARESDCHVSDCPLACLACLPCPLVLCGGWAGLR
jgi:hypothetical protein